MRSRTAHQFNEMPIFASRVTVTFDIADNLRINLGSSIKTKRSLNHLVLQVTIDSLRTTDNLNRSTDSFIILSQNTSVCIRIITTDNYYSFDIKFFFFFLTTIKLFFFLQFGTS